MNLNRRDFVKTLFAVTPALLAGTALTTRCAPVAPKAGSLNFLVVGDWGAAKPEETQHQIEVATQMARSSTSLGAKFILNVGDNFYEDGVASVEDPQWKTKFEDIYNAASLQVPWYSLLGNHDYHDNVEAQLEYAKRNPRWIMPSRYYSYSLTTDDQTTLDFFCLDTSPFIKSYLVDNAKKKNRGANVRAQQNEAPKQVAWLDNGLATSKADWKIVVGHHPMYSASADRDQQDMIDLIYPILDKHGVRVYFNGHDHNLQHLQAGKLNMFDSGAGSHNHEVVPNAETKYALDTPGYASVSVNRDAMQVTLIDNHGTALYTATVPRV